MRITDEISCFLAKYSYNAMAVDLERIVLTVTLFYSQFSSFFTQQVDQSTPEQSHPIYQQSSWYGNFISFFLDSSLTLKKLSSTEKRAVKQASIKYQLTDQHLFYIERCGKTTKCPLLDKIFFFSNGRMMIMGILQITLHFTRYGINDIGQLKLLTY